ncbi:MAG: hypothetical protein L6Q99_03125 [Planctomycetes bacterium]|nr:hypothetical protein [Planctomycetota bacterium]
MRTWLVIALLSSACQEQSGVAVEAHPDAAAKCEFCSATDGVHRMFRDTPKFLDALQGQERAALERAAATAGVQTQSSPTVCPLAFGPLPADGEVRIEPVFTRKDPRVWRCVWAVVGRHPFRHSTQSLLSAVIHGEIPPEERVFSIGADRVYWFDVELELTQDVDGKPVLTCALRVEPANGAMISATKSFEWTADVSSLDRLVRLSDAKLVAQLPCDVQLGYIDGNPLSLRVERDVLERVDFWETDGSSDERFRSRWSEARLERRRAGQPWLPTMK